MIYFDNCATTPPCAEAIDAARNALSENWGNPSSAHFAGVAAKRALDGAKASVASSLGLRRLTDARIIFTSGGTEANNLAIMGCVYSKERPMKGSSRGTVVISDGEHASVEAAAHRLEQDGFRIYRIPTKGGALDLDDLENNIGGDVVASSIMKVNNETGAIYDTKAAFKIIKAHSPDAALHTDCVQAYMKMRLTPVDLGADMISLSAHKIFACKGAGALYVSGEIIKKKRLVAVTYGGHQEEGFRAGTEGVPAIAAFGAAAQAGMKELTSRIERCASLGAYLEKSLSDIDGVRLNLPEKRLPNILNITVPGIKSETLMSYLSGEGICVSKSSACSTRAKNLSAALLAFGLSEEDVDSSLRISISHLNTEEEIDFFRDTLARGVTTLARIRR